MKYVGRFKDVNNESYYLEIITNNDETTIQNIEMGTPPFILEYESGDEIIYKPIKYSSATATIVSENILSDIYTGANQGTKIKLTNTQRTLFNGYITPNVYNQPYSGVAQNIELECVDGLSTLKNIDYTTVGNEKNIVSFAQIICHILKQCNCYTTLYISDVINSVENGANKIYDLFVSENNFFDEDDEPMKCNEVLEEILRYLNMTMFADGLNVYIVDYDAIGKYEYTQKYNVINIERGVSEVSLIKLNDEKTITADNYKGADADLSIDNVYNKATVVSDLYVVDELMGDVFDEKYLTNVGDYWFDTKTTQVITGPPDQTGANAHPKRRHILYYRIFENKNINHLYYNVDDVNKSSTQIPTSTNELNQNIGATLYAYFLDENNITEDSAMGSLSFTNCVLFHLHNTLTSSDEDYKTRRVLCEIKTNKQNVITNDNTVLVIRGSAKWIDKPRCYYDDKEYETAEYWTNETPYIMMAIKYEDKYFFDTKTNQWVDNNGIIEDYFVKLEFNVKSETSYLNEDLSIKNNIEWRMGLDTDGLALQLPSGTNLANVKFQLLQPHPFKASWHNYDDKYMPNIKNQLNSILLKDFSVEIKQKHNSTTPQQNEDDNTKYENVIVEDFVEELNEISFKVCTFDGKKLNFSSVYCRDENTLIYVDTLTNKALNQSLRQEEMLIYRVVKQYREPRIILNIELNNQYSMFNKITYPTQYNDKTFIIDNMSIDFENDTTSLKIIEKA